MSTPQNRNTAVIGGAALAAGAAIWYVSGSRSSAGSSQPEDANSTMQKGLGDVRQGTAAATDEKPSHDR